MSNPVSKEIREKIVRHKQNHETECDIAKWLMISQSTVTKVWARYKATGSYEPSPRTQGRKPAVDEATMACLENKIKESPDMTLLELIDEFSLGISESALSKKLKKVGYTYKKTNISDQAGYTRSGRRTR